MTISAINAAWMSSLNEQQGALVFPVSRYKERLTTAEGVHVIVMHHPLNWYHQSMYHALRATLRSGGHLILSGHEHEGAVFQIEDAANAQSVYLEAPALQPEDSATSGLSIVDLDLDNELYRTTTFAFRGGAYEPLEFHDEWLTFRKLPEKKRNVLDLTEDFSSALDDPGANYHHVSKGDLRLSDVFVFPDLEELKSSGVPQKLIRSDFLEVVPEQETRFVLTGDEQSGKSALLRTLFRRYYDAGLLPVLISATALRQATAEGVESAVEAAVVEQYGQQSLQAWRAVARLQKVLLLDDFDQSVVADRYRGRMLEHIQARFGHVVLTASTGQDVRELVSSDATDVLRPYRHLNIRPFGYKLRYALIKRWRTLGDDHALSSGELIAQIDDAEKVIDTVIGSNVVPRTPFYLLTLLQSLDDTGRPDLRASAYGHYYQYLIVRALERAHFPRDQLDELFNYCAHLAWFVHQAGDRGVDERALKGFNDVFSKEFVSIDFERRVRVLVNAKMLRKRGDYYTFAYGYIYYWFLGMYLSKKLDHDQEVRQLIAEYSDQLHIREYANAILFLAHHSSDPRVIESIVSKLRSLFGTLQALTLEADTVALNDLVEQTTRLVFHGGDPDTNRVRDRALMDELDSGSTRTAAPADETGGLGVELDALFRTVEILGQILKNQYGTLPNARKQELMAEVFSGPLRALRSLVEFAQAHKDGLIAEIEALISELSSAAGKRIQLKEHVARRVAFELIAAMAYFFIQKAANAIGSRHLKDTADAVVSKLPTAAFRLIRMAAILESANPLPVDEIRALAQETEGNIFAHRLLEIAVLRHLYFFKTSDSQKQELTEILGVSMATQRSIAQRGSSSKLLRDGA